MLVVSIIYNFYGARYIKKQYYIYFEEKENLLKDIEILNQDNEILKLKHQDAIAEVRISEEAKYNKLLGQKKSSEVKLGQIAEQLFPLLDAWPYDPKNFRFTGSPVDGVSFEEDKIVFVEAKSGGSRLSKKQNHIKQLVAEGKVEFVVIRVNNKGITVT